MADQVLKAFITYASIVVLKTMAMSVVTAIQRFRNKSFANPEDAKGMKDREGGKLRPMVCEAVERVRRCHQNDLENVIPFVLIGLLYVNTSPDLATALLHFRLFAGSRVLHSFAYLIPLPQPSRALTFFIGFATTISMGVRCLSYTGFSL